MSYLTRALSDSESKSGSILDLIRGATGSISASGKNVTVDNAVKVSTVFAICKVIGEGVAQIPFKLMRVSADERTRESATDHPLYEVLKLKPNPWQTSFEYREQLVWHTILTGNHYTFINRTSQGVAELVPLIPSQVTPKQHADHSITYKVRASDGQTKDFPQEAIWHVRGPSWNGWQGLEVVKLAREAVGLAMAAEEAAGSLHRNGIQSTGAYSVEEKLNAQQYKELSDWIAEHNAGSANSGKPLILDRAAKWVSSQMTGVEAQAIETRRFQIEEICRYGRVMPIMVGYADKAQTYASAEQMFLAHVVHTLAPWYSRIEQSADANLLSEKERKAGLYSNFVEEGLLRGTSKETRETILGYVNGGLITPNEGRAKLDMNPDSNPKSDELREPANITGDTTGSDPEANPKTEE